MTFIQFELWAAVRPRCGQLVLPVVNPAGNTDTTSVHVALVEPTRHPHLGRTDAAEAGAA